VCGNKLPWFLPNSIFPLCSIFLGKRLVRVIINKRFLLLFTHPFYTRKSEKEIHREKEIGEGVGMRKEIKQTFTPKRQVRSIQLLFLYLYYFIAIIVRPKLFLSLENLFYHQIKSWFLLRKH